MIVLDIIAKMWFILHYFEQDFENRRLEKVCVITDQKVEELIMLCIIFCVNKLIITVIIFSNVIGASAILFFRYHSLQL